MGPKESNQTISMYSKTCVKQQLSKIPNIGFQDLLSLNAGQKYCRMLQREHSAILLTCIKLPFVIMTFVLSVFEWPFCTGFIIFHIDRFAFYFTKIKIPSTAFAESWPVAFLLD